MIVITGAAGFIGSYLIGHLNERGYNNIVAVDDFSHEIKNKNLLGKKVLERIDRKGFEAWLKNNYEEVEFIFHLGARTDTAEFDRELLKELNTDYSKMVWRYCVEHQIPLVYASSAATYGLGEYGYDDNEKYIHKLTPLNPYGDSKQEFDLWVLDQEEKPFYWAGLKFFNVYGPGEFHKGRMASVVFHAYNQITATGKMKLFRSHNPNFKDGEQKRDFIYIEDVAKVCTWLMEEREKSGIYNLGTGKARTFKDLVLATFSAMGKEPVIEFIDTPEDIRDKYQYFTEANMEKLKESGYEGGFVSLEEGVEGYIDFLNSKKQ